MSAAEIVVASADSVRVGWKDSDVTVRTWQQESRNFRVREWADIRSFLAEMAARNPSLGYLVDIVDSVLVGERASALCATTSMHDLIVSTMPVPDPPFGVIAVRAPGSVRPPSDGNVLIEHLSVTGHNDRIERPAAEAVPLFWRFAIEKFGTQPPGR